MGLCAAPILRFNTMFINQFLRDWTTDNPTDDQTKSGRCHRDF
ncbi:Uncharacterised protein [Vibrio cholerae]|nr:Uncharacterised protein [Vibrio cholerae]CSI66706.1 Uncharacterised protein [Vibrio cholerae]